MVVWYEMNRVEDYSIGTSASASSLGHENIKAAIEVDVVDCS